MREVNQDWLKSMGLNQDWIRIVKNLCEANLSSSWIAEKMNINLAVLQRIANELEITLTYKSTKSTFVSALKMYVTIHKSKELVERKTKEILAHYLGINRLTDSFEIIDLATSKLRYPYVSTEEEKRFLNLLLEIFGSYLYTADYVWDDFLREICDCSNYNSLPKNPNELIAGFCSFWANDNRKKIGTDWRGNPHVAEIFNEVLESLKPKDDAEIICKRFGIGIPKPMKLKEIAKEHGGVSVERIRQRIARALRSLRHPSRSYKLKRLYFIKPTLLDEEKTVRDLQQNVVAEIAATELNTEIEINLNKPIKCLELSARSSGCLRGHDIIFVGDLVSNRESELLEIKNFGRKSLNEIKYFLSEMNLYLGMDISGWKRPTE